MKLTEKLIDKTLPNNFNKPVKELTLAESSVYQREANQAVKIVEASQGNSIKNNEKKITEKILRFVEEKRLDELKNGAKDIQIIRSNPSAEKIPKSKNKLSFQKESFLKNKKVLGLDSIKSNQKPSS